MPEQTLSIPSLLLLVIVLFLTARYMLSPSSPRARAPRLDPALVEQIAAMFPHVARRHIAWDLQRNGGSVAATTERILSEGGLDVPPPSFQPPLPPSSIHSNPQTRTRAPAAAPVYSDLITRYNLGARLASQDTSSPTKSSDQPSRPADTGTWASSRTERQALLAKRRDEMILSARRRLEEEERERKREKGK